MAVYEKLLLSTGGGIISSKQQTEQVRNTATLLIGLGGTGVHCIRTIKTQVYDRLRPDLDEDIPEYSHIRFLGIDTTAKSRGGDLKEYQPEDGKKADEILSLMEETEFFNIGNKKIKNIFNGVKALKARKELSWLVYDKIDITNLSDAGAGGIRQVGRLMMMDKSRQLMAKIREEIDKAREGFDNPSINIHIFSGLSGGTGSGCFLDICYMLKYILQNIGATVFGYFFLPDVNLSNIPQKNEDMRNHIRKNGYAAMQELDYCMRLEQNGGSFVQTYQGNTQIKWNCAPVDMCHLICATDENGKVIPNAYKYAMNVVAEYVMDMLTFAPNEEFGLKENLSNFKAYTQEADKKKTFGTEVAYCAIGASCARIPLREINTYLASELFAKFAVTNQNLPTQADVKRFALDALAKKGINDIYESLLAEIQENIGDYRFYPDSHKEVLAGDAGFTRYYTDQTAEYLGRAETNAKSMVSEKNKKSLINRIRSELVSVICDIDRGPAYAYNLFNSSKSHNLLNLIDGWIQENMERKKQYQYEYNTTVRKSYENARSTFLDSGRWTMDRTVKKRFEIYEACTVEHEKYKLFLGSETIGDGSETTGIFEKLDEILKRLRIQIEHVQEQYYKKLFRVMDTLINTFGENRNALRGTRTLNARDGFTIPMMTIQELRKSLDKRVEEIDERGLFEQFMGLFLRSDNEQDWLTENENKITHLVTKFFVDDAFYDFAERTITSFLQDKYNEYNDNSLTIHIYNDWIKMLTEKARPLFFFNQNVWKEDQTTKLAFVSYPQNSMPIKNAAKKREGEDKMWGCKPSALTDRIFVMCSACCFPLSADSNCAEYERLYFSSKEHGIHYYEGNPVENMTFTDWGELPPITPQSLIEDEGIPIDEARMLTKAKELFQRAKGFGVIDEDGCICRPDETGLQNLRDVCSQCEKALPDSSKDALSKMEMQIRDSGGDVLKAPGEDKAVKRLVNMEKVPGYSLPIDGLRDQPSAEETIEEIQRDYFVSSPAFYPIASGYVEQIEAAKEQAEALLQKIEERKSTIDKVRRDREDYYNAVFTGVIELNGNLITYESGKYGISKTYELSKIGTDFPYGKISIYQGFKKYCELEEKVKQEIAEKANDILTSRKDEVIARIGRLKEEFSEKRVKEWTVYAQQREDSKDICEFLFDIRENFQIHCEAHE